MLGTGGSPGHIPARQQPHDIALSMGFEALLSRTPSNETLRELDVEMESGRFRIPVLNRVLIVDPEARDVFIDGGSRTKRAWAVLAVHYLCARDLSVDTREVSFAHFADSRGYLKVFEGRIIGRFLATTGRTEERFVQMAEELRGERLPIGGTAYRFPLLPRVPIVIVRHEGDEEFGPGASVIYRADIEHLLPAEDRIVATELLLDALAGKSLEEQPGGRS